MDIATDAGSGRFPTPEQQAAMMADCDHARAKFRGCPFVSDMACHVKALLCEVERLNAEWDRTIAALNETTAEHNRLLQDNQKLRKRMGEIAGWIVGTGLDAEEQRNILRLATGDKP